MTNGTVLGFGSLPERNNNYDVRGKYSDTHFRIRKNGYDSSGREEWKEEVKTAYINEVKNILSSQGWTFVEPDMSGSAPSAVKGKNNLYLHPQDFSGVCENTEREALYELFKKANTFMCETVDIYREIFDMTDEQLTEKLQESKEEIKNRLLETLTTKRRNLYITDVGFFGVCGNIGKKYSVKRLAIDGKHSWGGVDDRTDGICSIFVYDIFKELVDSGNIVTAETKNGTGYRTAKKDELKKKTA